MEPQLNKSGNRRGLHGKTPKGGQSKSAKGWILYKNDEEVGFFPTLFECAEVTGMSKQYMWMLAREKAINSDGPRKVSKEGWSIKPAISISFTNK